MSLACVAGSFHNAIMKLAHPSLSLERKYAWVYLMNLGFFIVPMFLYPFTVLEHLAMLLALSGFIASYYWAFSVASTHMKRPILTMYLIACAITTTNPASITMFGFVAFFLGFAYRMRIALLGLVGILSTLALLHYFVVNTWTWFAYYGAALSLAIFVIGRVERARQQHLLSQQRTDLEIEQLATTLERERIARDLHDTLGHTLTSVLLKAELAQRYIHANQNDAAHQHLTELTDIARTCLKQVRESVTGYKHGGFDFVMQQLALRLKEAGFKVNVQGHLTQVNRAYETPLVLALTELVTNIIRHSQGDDVDITFSENAQNIFVEVHDNGQVTKLEWGNGLLGVHERIERLGGRIEVETQHGCSVRLFIPAANLEPSQ
ncbi:two-component system sensor histidine kinase DesK [Idiomarina fontislapidosi]|nr:two-component system sensor histidine kinase DesK [Idiomarina fontislapidosi]